MRARAVVSSLVVACCVTALLTACNDDGRTLRDPRPDQVGSVSTTAAPTTVALDPLQTADIGTLPTSVLPVGSGDVPVLPVGSGDVPALPLGTGDVPPVEGLQSAWTDGGEIPVRYACNDVNVSPPLVWAPAPTGTVEIAVTLEDQDRPDFVHWVMSGIDPFATSLAEGAIPEFAIVGVNSQGLAKYTGPCPPVGETHTYVYTVHFLDQATELSDGVAGADLQAFVKGATFESRTISGTYSQG
ncbi:MAG: YbhB/YbcL family Raf kinase inhibitor-like protein [Acidimicrobiales bacterium]